MSIRPPHHRHAPAFQGLLQAALVVVSTVFMGGVHAASATGTFTTSMPVNSPTCTVATNNSAVALPTGASQTQTLSNYFSTNSLTTVGQHGSPWMTNAALNQTATITCSTASVPILSFVVEPAAGAILNSSFAAEALLVDSASTPNKAAAGNLIMNYEQISVNGAAPPAAYEASGGAIQPYATTFTTSAVTNGTATVVWRPTFFDLSSTTALGTPSGGSYNSPGQIVVNY